MSTNSENRNCQNCKTDFIIEPDDFGFYKKMKVPPPTFCPSCRFQRRMTWRNDWHVFKKTDARTGEKVFSLFPEESPVKIYDRDYWWGDKWDPLTFGRNYDFTKSFFEQFKELMQEVPLPSTSMEQVVNCQYCTNASYIKNCYLVRGATGTEDSAYLIWDHASKECLDSHMTNSCELGYWNVNTITCYRTFFSVDCESSQELVLCKDCVGCNSCFGSVGLRNKSYYIFNIPYSREEYQKKLEEFNLGSKSNFDKLKAKAYEKWLEFPQKYMHGRQNVKVSGDYIYESKNAIDCFRVHEVEDSKYVQNITNGPLRDCYDYSNFGNGAELVYESLVVGSGAYNVKFCSQCFPNNKDISYSIFCNNASDLFGCVSVRNKKYCILNKQYTKDEYEKLTPKIIEHMKKTGEYGEFFPSALSAFPYKVTAAYEFFPENKEEAKSKGFSWYDIEKPNYKATLFSKDIPDDIKDLSKSILNEVIECEHKNNCGHECTHAFRVIQQEVDFLLRMNLPFPRLCTNCRHEERLLLRNSPVLYSRTCMCEKEEHTHKGKCLSNFETSYAPDRLEKIYCESCYNKEVY